MAAEIRFLDTDESTVITTLYLGQVPTPGLQPKKLFVENIGDATAQDLTVSLQELNNSDGIDFAQTAVDNSGIPGPFQEAALDLGDLLPGETVALWTRAALIAGITTDNNAREYRLHAEALSSGGGGGGDPIPTADMLWHFNSDEIVGLSNTDPLATWPDAAPDPHDMVFPGSNGGTQPEYRDNGTDNINGHPVVHTVSGDQGEIEFPNFSPAVDDQSFTLYWVGRYTPGANPHGILIYSYETDTLRLYLEGDLDGSDQVGYEYDVGSGAVDVDLAAGISGEQLLTFIFDKSAGTATLRRNGVEVGTSTDVGGTGAGNGFDWGTDLIEFFAVGGGSFGLVGDTARIIAYKTAHDLTTVQGIETELMTIYAL